MQAGENVQTIKQAVSVLNFRIAGIRLQEGYNPLVEEDRLVRAASDSIPQSRYRFIITITHFESTFEVRWIHRFDSFAIPVLSFSNYDTPPR